MRIFLQNIDNKTEIFKFDNDMLTISDLGEYFKLDLDQVSFISNGRILKSSTLLSSCESSKVEARLSLKGGKGGFGSLLKGQPAVKKRTKNFDACRDISGRRLRHVNQEKQLIDWQQKKEEEDRIINQSNTGNADEIKKRLHEDKRNDIVRENQKFFSEDMQTKRAVEKSLNFLTKKRKREKVVTKFDQKDDQPKNPNKETKIDIKAFEIKEDISKEDLMNEILAL